MFDKDSRYANLPLKETTDIRGRKRRYVARRIIRDDIAPIAQIKVQPGDRIDHLSERAYGDPRQFWRFLDANPTLFGRDTHSKWWLVKFDGEGQPIRETDPLADRVGEHLKLNPVEAE